MQLNARRHTNATIEIVVCVCGCVCVHVHTYIMRQAKNQMQQQPDGGNKMQMDASGNRANRTPEN